MTKIVTFSILALFAAVVAYQVIGRVPSETLSVAVGVLCGITASIPVSIGLVIALLRRRDATAPQVEWRDAEPEPDYYPQPQRRQPQPAPQQPQIIVIAPPQGQYPNGGGYGIPLSNFGYPYAQQSNETVEGRDWKIIGDEQ